MSDQQDIVARLRAYTQHNRPVLSSDLKIAADYIEQLQRELIAAIAQRDVAKDDLAACRRMLKSPTERFDEIERRTALLESSTRTTERRFALVAAKLAEASNRIEFRGTSSGVAFMDVSSAILSVDKDGPK